MAAPRNIRPTARFKGRGGQHIPATTVQTLADRLTKALKRFLARKELAMKAGFPRFKSANQWHCIQLRQYGKDCYLHEDKKHLIVPGKLGKSIKIKLHRPFEGKPKTVYLVLRADDHWYALIACETEPQTEQTPSSCEHPDIGIDVGLKVFLADSEGNTVANPRYYRTSQKTLRRQQRQLCRRKKGSKRRRKAAKNVAKTHLKMSRQRRDFHFKAAKPYVENYQHMAVEDLNVCGMLKSHSLAKSISDASWSAFLDILSHKAERAGHRVIRVSPHFTSQQCHKCREIVQKSLSVRTHICPFCGYVADRDVNAAKNILLKARAELSGTVSDGRPVELRSPRL
jgi:putative transposase